MNNLKNYLAIIAGLMFIVSCSKDDCEYKVNCTESTKIIEDFEDTTVLNWVGINTAVVSIVSSGTPILNSNLFVDDAPGFTYVYNTINYNSQIMDSACELTYDFNYKAISGTSTAPHTNSLIIFDGADPTSSLLRADFVLNAANHISVTGTTIETITVPLTLANTSGNTLPSNSFGDWTINNHSAPFSATEIADFNTLIQNTNGIAFYLDWVDGEEWGFDNFKIKTCCP